MSDLLIELFQEEIPARMQAAAEENFARLVTDRLKANGIAFDICTAYSTPRRIALHVTGIPVTRADVVEELKGPAVAAPQQAIAGFIKKAGVTDVSELVTRDVRGTDYYFYESIKKGGATIDVLGVLIADAINNMPWPKSMRWGYSAVRWVRPLHNILAVFDGQVVKGEFVAGPDMVLTFNNRTKGHRFMGSGETFEVSDFANYRAQLADNFVIVDRATRKQKIMDGVSEQVAKLGGGCSVLDDEKLLEEVVGLVEWPVPFIGSFDAHFLDIPQEVITTSMRENQRYFSVLDKNGKLSNHFVCVANMVPDDGGKIIIHGNQKVLRARLSDARFFWDQDLKLGLEDYLPKLEQVRFHEKLGMMSEKIGRLEKLASEIASLTGADVEKSVRAAHLCKADLVTGMVREFPEIQGVMGGYYAAKSGEDAEVAEAIRTHYSPVGPSDSCPSAPVSVVLALADKIDTLVGFFSIGEKPTGSKDPFALRRAALGVIRILTENAIDIDLGPVLAFAAGLYQAKLPEDLEAFILDRFKVLMKGESYPHQVIEAVRRGTLIDMKERISQISSFIETDKGRDFVAAAKRAINILESEEKKTPALILDVVEAKFVEPEERDLYQALVSALPEVESRIGARDYRQAMTCLANIKDKVDLFFERVVVNDNDPDVRCNRLAVLSHIRVCANMIADFSKL